jgi:hypothetical protein
MSRVVTDSKHYTDIANALREAAGTEATYKPEDMAANISGLYGKGYKDGGNGVLSYATNIDYMFHEAVFPEGTELEVYVPNFIDGMDWVANTTTGLVKLTLRCDNTEGELDCAQAFLKTSVKILDLSQWKRTIARSAVNFAQASALVTIIGDLDLSNMTSTFNFLSGAGNLVDVTFVPNTIGCDLSISGASGLSAESAKSAILGLKNFSGTDKAYAYTFTLHANVWALLDAEGATAPGGVTWKTYVDNLGWNT